MVAIMWIVFLLDSQLSLGLTRLGIVPRDLVGLRGLLFWPFLHANVPHLASNSTPLLLFGVIIASHDPRNLLRLTVFISLFAGVGIWLLARPAVHIGASGLVFGYFGYIIVRGYYDRSFSSVLIAGVIIVLFGGMIWGVLPSDPHISWEGHLLGLTAGVVWARGIEKPGSTRKMGRRRAGIR